MKTLLPLLLAALLLAAPAVAAPGPGGPGRPGPAMAKPCTDARQALHAPRGARCELVGHLEPKGKDLFEFRDRSGSIPVRVKPGAIKGRHDPKAPVKIFGTVREDRGRVEVDVDRVDFR